MNTTESPTPDPVPLAALAYESSRGPRSHWHVVAKVIATLGLLMSSNMLTTAFHGPQSSYGLQNHPFLNRVVYLMGIAGNLWLFVHSIALLRRAPWAAVGLYRYGYADVIYTIAVTVIWTWSYAPMLGGGAQFVMQMQQTAAYCLMGCVYPIFCIVVFRSREVRDELARRDA